MVADEQFVDLEGETDKIVQLCEEVAIRSGLDLKEGFSSAFLLERTIIFTNSAGRESAFVEFRNDEPGKSRVIGDEQFLEQVTAVVQSS